MSQIMRLVLCCCAAFLICSAHVTTGPAAEASSLTLIPRDKDHHHYTTVIPGRNQQVEEPVLEEVIVEPPEPGVPTEELTTGDWLYDEANHIWEIAPYDGAADGAEGSISGIPALDGQAVSHGSGARPPSLSSEELSDIASQLSADHGEQAIFDTEGNFVRFEQLTAEELAAPPPVDLTPEATEKMIEALSGEGYELEWNAERALYDIVEESVEESAGVVEEVVVDAGEGAAGAGAAEGVEVAGEVVAVEVIEGEAVAVAVGEGAIEGGAVAVGGEIAAGGEIVAGGAAAEEVAGALGAGSAMAGAVGPIAVTTGVVAVAAVVVLGVLCLTHTLPMCKKKVCTDPNGNWHSHDSHCQGQYNIAVPDMLETDVIVRMDADGSQVAA